MLLKMGGAGGMESAVYVVSNTHAEAFPAASTATPRMSVVALSGTVTERLASASELVNRIEIVSFAFAGLGVIEMAVACGAVLSSLKERCAPCPATPCESVAVAFKSKAPSGNLEVSTLVKSTSAG